jgi:aspartyl-tRNA(Asn)/glutamyl-tRNA(Gln) amidotransferase subunit A
MAWLNKGPSVGDVRMSTDLSALPVHALSAGLTAGQFSSVDLVDACLARIAALEPKLQAFVHVHKAEARQAAEAADKAIRAGQAVGPLHGIPIAIKDLVEVKDHPTAAGCAVWRQRMSAYNAASFKSSVSKPSVNQP